jgi:hypothetical protein
MSHSYTGPSGRRYHLDAEGSLEGSAFTDHNGEEVEISMRDIIWLAALHKRGFLVELAESSSDLAVLGLKVFDSRESE